MQWYKHYLADYLQKTADLSLIEHGAYRLLMDTYYQREAPLPNDLKLIYRLVHAHHRHEQHAVRTILGRYFTMLDGHFINVRANEEIESYQAQCSANRRPNRQRIVNESPSESHVQIDRIDRDKEEAFTKTACQHRMESGEFCGIQGTHKLHPRSKDWYCRQHPDG